MISKFKLRALLASDELRRRCENKAPPKPDQPTCFGDYHRLRLAEEGRVGYPQKAASISARKARETAYSRQRARLGEWLAGVEFPPLVNVSDFAAAIGPERRGGVGVEPARMMVAAELKSRGGWHRIDLPALALWTRGRRFRSMSPAELMVTYRQTPLGGAQAGAERGSASGGVGQGPTGATKPRAWRGARCRQGDDRHHAPKA